MKNKALWKIGRLIEIFCEKCLEWVEYFWHTFAHKLNRKKGRNLLEEYSIKKEYIGKEYVKEFLEERKRNIEKNGYRMRLLYSYSSDKEEEIGSVTLYCRGRHLDRAILTAGQETGNGKRLIYWNLNRQKHIP